MKLRNPILPLTILLALFSTYLLAEKTDPPKFHRSSDFGWTANQDITLEFNQLLEDGKLGVGSELLLEHRYRISGSHTLPKSFTLVAEKGAGFDVIDAASCRKPLLVLSDQNTLRNLTINYKETPPLGPTGEKHEVNFTNRLGIQASGKSKILIENCQMIGSINHHIKLIQCSDLKVIGCHIAGGHWSVFLSAVDGLVFRRCLIEKCQGDGIKTGDGSKGIVRNVVVEDCVFQDNLRDGIDTTGGFNKALIRNCIFRRLGTAGLDLKSHYELKTGRIEDHAPENVGIVVENCLFHDMPNAVILTTLDCGRRDGPGKEFLNANNGMAYAPHDIDINNCIIGHAERPLKSVRDGGYGVNYPGSEGEHMRMILLKDAHSIRYKNARLSGDRIMPVKVSSIGGSRHLSKEAASAIDPTITGKVIAEPAPPIEPGKTETPFIHGPQDLEKK